jgi:hypothetical protein
MAAIYGLCGIAIFLASLFFLIQGLLRARHQAWHISPALFGRRTIITRAEHPVKYWISVALGVLCCPMGLWLAAEWLFEIPGPRHFIFRLFSALRIGWIRPIGRSQQLPCKI